MRRFTQCYDIAEARDAQQHSQTERQVHLTFAAFGCALDVLDAPEKLAMKLAYLNALREGVISGPPARDPYELLTAALDGTAGLVTVGRLELESWMTPRPGLEQGDLVDALLYREFLDTGGCSVVAARLREFVKDRVLPLAPFLIGVDHSLTGAVLEALAAQGGAGMGLVVLDSHFDALGAGVRKAAAEAVAAKAGRTAEAEPDGTPGGEETAMPEGYTCGTWLASAIERGLVDPSRVAVVGVSDRPPEEPLESGPDGGSEPAAMAAFREAYLGFERKGVTVITKKRIRESGSEAAAKETLARIGPGPLYISIDADIGAGQDVKAVRFLDTIGLEPDEVVGLCGALASGAAERGAPLVGFDVMEMDVHLADMPGSDDRTLEMCAGAARAIMGG